MNQKRHKNVVYLDQQPHNQTEKTSRNRLSRKQLTQWVLGGITALVLGTSAWSLYQTVNAYQEQQLALQEAKTEYQAAQESHAQLVEESKRVSDPEYLGQIARRDYYYSKPGEIVFELDQDGQAEHNNE